MPLYKFDGPMLRFILVLILTALGSWFALDLMPWWIVMLIGFVLVLLMPMRGLKAFFATGLGAALAFLLLTYSADHANEHILSTRMATLFFHSRSYSLMILVTVVYGMITAGLGGWTAAALRRLLAPVKTEVPPVPTEQ